MTDQVSGWAESDSAFFIEHGDVITPSRAEQLQTVAQLIPAEINERFVVADLACGAGLLSAAILDRFPCCRIVALDGSAAMLHQAQLALSRFSDRVEYRNFDLFDREWIERLPDDLRCVVSSLAIHHLDAARKQTLFRDIHERLSPGGALLIADIVEPVNDHVRLQYADA